MSDFQQEVVQRLAENGRQPALLEAGLAFLRTSAEHRYSYNFAWMGRPIIQYPQDMVAMQELIWQVRPDLIVETGIAHGGSLMLSASMLALLDYCDAIESNEMLDPSKPKRRVVAVDIDIRAHNRAAIEAHPLANRIDMIQGSSTAPDVIEQVKAAAQGYRNVLVCLDSNHTHEHVLAELEAYAPLVTVGSYCVAFDTVIEDMPADSFPDRPWGIGDNPKTAVREFVRKHSEFEIDFQIDHKLLISVAPEGYLKRVR
jgi:cephalosporin hydroxylase